MYDDEFETKENKIEPSTDLNSVPHTITAQLNLIWTLTFQTFSKLVY